MAKINDYPFEVRPLSDEDGGGYLISFPDFAECIADGESYASGYPILTWAAHR